MLVVLSDLHFEEEATDHIPGRGSLPPVYYSRNLPGRAFTGFIIHLANEARRNRAQQLDLVLAGDVFDIHRTSLWFIDNPGGLRPYVRLEDVGPALEARTLDILEGIAAEEDVAVALAAFRLLCQGQYWDKELRAFPVPVRLHFLPGNHDRLVNATPELRDWVRRTLGLASAADPFPHALLFPQEQVLIRHGHEYDRANFLRDYSQEEVIPTSLPAQEYSAAPFGDFATVDIASRIPFLFRLLHTDERVLGDHTLRATYLRLLEFDDLRPQRAMLNFLLHMPEYSVEPAAVWAVLEPVVCRLLEEIYDDPFLETWLDRMDKKWRLDFIDVIQASLTLQSWRLAGLPLGLAQFVSKAILSGGNLRRGEPVAFAAREEAIQKRQVRFVVAGHTHQPATELITADTDAERYYVDTGTWRNQLPANQAFKAFGRLRSLTYVIFYGPEEDQGQQPRPAKRVSFDYWSGFTQRW
ncbi:MAG: hypothetical protein ACRDHL_02000 [Candidatus Promineifilaceae bacterium]